MNTMKRFWALCLDTHMKLALYKYAINIIIIIIIIIITIIIYIDFYTKKLLYRISFLKLSHIFHRIIFVQAFICSLTVAIANTAMFCIWVMIWM